MSAARVSCIGPTGVKLPGGGVCELQGFGRVAGAIDAKRDGVKPQDRGEHALTRMMELVAEDLAACNRLIVERMHSQVALIPQLAAHIVAAGGKRLRPLLTLAASKLCGYSGQRHVALAACVEFIHTATLLHDDVVDESKKRRGRPTANLLWDNKSSVLVGDYLFARSFQLMTECGSLEVVTTLANASAVISEGEVLQLTAAQNLETGTEIYLNVVRGKTAALFSAACEVGAMVADATDAQRQALFTYGDALGIAFQMADDLLDYGGTSAIGKNIGDDFRERKLTLPVILAVEKADASERAFWVRVIEKGDQREGDLEEALRLMKAHGTLEATRVEAQAWADKARAALSALPDHPLRGILGDVASYVVARLS